MNVDARAEITDVVYRWCRAIDRRDFDGIFACFHPDAIDDHVFYSGTIEGLVDCLRERHSNISFSMHAVSNIWIEGVLCDAALVESYVKVVQRRPLTNIAEDAAHNSHVSEVYCRYVDIFERRAGEWKISKRTLLIDTAMEYTDIEPVHRLPTAESVNRGRRDLSDTVYVERAKYAALG